MSKLVFIPSAEYTPAFIVKMIDSIDATVPEVFDLTNEKRKQDCRELIAGFDRVVIQEKNDGQPVNMDDLVRFITGATDETCTIRADYVDTINRGNYPEPGDTVIVPVTPSTVCVYRINATIFNGTKLTMAFVPATVRCADGRDITYTPYLDEATGAYVFKLSDDKGWSTTHEIDRLKISRALGYDYDTFIDTYFTLLSIHSLNIIDYQLLDDVNAILKAEGIVV